MWGFRLLTAVLAPLLVVAVAEVVLWLAGYGYPTSFFRPQVVQGSTCLVENAAFGRRFFPAAMARSPAPTVVATPKPPGRFRIFLFGESAALGDPAPAFGVGRYLQALLRERYPRADLEVVCAAMTAINSHALLPMARECTALDGDLWLIYMGNNEMIGPFGAATVFGAQAPPGWLICVRLKLGQLRVMQALSALSDRWRGAGDARTWEGMKLFVEHRLAPDDPARETVYRNFRANLEAMLRAGESAGVPIVLSTVAVNLKHFPPLASLPRAAAGTNLPPSFAAAMAQGDAARGAGGWPVAQRSYEQALAVEPRHAEARFRLGQAHLALSNGPAAKVAFAQARDDDALPFRADSRLNALITEAGREHAGRGVRFLDAASALAAPCAEQIPGDELFYEHVHFHFGGNYRLALALAEQIAPLLPARITETATAGWASQATCERDLGLTDWNRVAVLDDVLRRLQQPPFSTQPDAAAHQQLWRSRLAALRQRLTATNAAAAREVYREALQKSPHDFRLYWNQAEFLEAVRDLPGATAAWREVQVRIPQHHVGAYQVGRLLAEQGQRPEARQWLTQAITLRPDLAAGWTELGKLDQAEGRHEEAIGKFAQASQLVRQDPAPPLLTARSLMSLKRPEEALQAARESVRCDPNYVPAHLFLGDELAAAGRHPEAQAAFETVLRITPDQPRAHLNLGVALFKQGWRDEAIRHFEAVSPGSPESALARNYLGQIRAHAVTNQPAANPPR